MLMAITLLIIILSYVGYNLHKKIYNVTYPPVTNKCPDGWDLSGITYDAVDGSSYSCIDPSCNAAELLTRDSSCVWDSDFKKTRSRCDTKKWAQQLGLHWPGITGVENDGCDNWDLDDD